MIYKYHPKFFLKGSDNIIKVNNKPYEWKQNFTVESLIEEVKGNEDIFKYRGFHIMVVINEKLISYRVYDKHIIENGDNIKVLSVAGGG